MQYKKSISALIAICIVISLFSMVILPKESVAATVTGLTNQYTYVRAAPYWTAEVIDTMAAGVAITIYERDYEYIYVEWTNAGVVKRGYIPRANTATTGYSWCSHSIFVPGKTTVNKTVYYKPGGSSYGTVYANEYPLLILRQSGSYYFVQYTTNPDATGSTNPKFKRGWVTTSSITLDPPATPNINALINTNPTYVLIRNGITGSTSATYLTAVADSSSASGYKLSFTSGTGNTNQQWKLHKYTYSGGTYYKIQSVSCGLYIEIDGRIPVLGSKFILAAFGDPQKAQEFVIDYLNYNTSVGYRSYIRTRCSGDYLVAQKSNSDLVQQRESSGNADYQYLYIDPIDNHWSNGHAGGRRTLTYYIDPYTVLTGNITTDIIEAAANSWNNISDISLTRVMSESNADLIIEGGTNAIRYSGKLFIKSSGDTDWRSDDSVYLSTWYKGKIEINVNKSDEGYMGDKSVNDIKMNIAHEMGHFLKLSHPHEGYTGSGEYTTYINICSVMNQGLPSISSLCSVTPSAYDIRSLKIKWDQ